MVQHHKCQRSQYLRLLHSTVCTHSIRYATITRSSAYGQKHHLTVSPEDFKFEGEALQILTGAAPDKIGRSLPPHPSDHERPMGSINETDLTTGLVNITPHRAIWKTSCPKREDTHRPRRRTSMFNPNRNRT